MPEPGADDAHWRCQLVCAALLLVAFSGGIFLLHSSGSLPLKLTASTVPSEQQHTLQRLKEIESGIEQLYQQLQLHNLTAAGQGVADPGPPSSQTASDPDLHRLHVMEQLYGLRGNLNGLAYLDLLDSSNLAPLTKETQQWIWEKQHPDPSSCHQQQFLLAGTDLTGNNGLGSCIHVISRQLSGALQNGRIMVYAANLCGHLVDEGCGRNESTTNLLCLFQAPSSCGLEHVTSSNSVPFFELGGAHVFPPDSGQVFDSECPPELAERLRQHFADQHIELTDAYLKYWWRGQAAAYLARLNDATLKAVADLRVRPDRLQHLTQHEQPSKIKSPLFPLPPGTLYVHVRHGEKAREMRLLQLSDILEAAEHSLVNAGGPLLFKKFAFLASDDPDVFKQAKTVTKYLDETSPDKQWTIIASNDPRLDHAMVEWTEDLVAFGRSSQITHHILNLFVGLECDAWAGTRGSNWARLIDELRCTWLDKCQYPFLEVGPNENWWEYQNKRRLTVLVLPGQSTALARQLAGRQVATGAAADGQPAAAA